MADSQPKSLATMWHKMPVFGIRARLIVLALLAIAPLMLERVHSLETARTERTERANAEVLDLARRGAESQHETIDSVRALLRIVARFYAEMPIDSPNCNRYLSEVAAKIAWMRSLSFAGPEGQLKCSNDPLALGLSVADRAQFQNALHTRDFALSDYVINRVHKVPSLVATFPALKEDNSLNGVVMAVINLQWIGDLAATAAQRSGASVVVIDGGGTLIAGSNDQDSLVGKRFAGHVLAREMLAGDERTMTVPGFDGVRRIFASVRIPWTNARLAVGLDESAVHSEIDHKIDIAYLQLVLFGLFVLLLAWFAGEQLIVRPIRSLVRTATRFGRGDLQVRATHEPWVAEFAPLAAALDDMATKLAEREGELKIANQHLDELASLDGLSGLANRRGFDRELEREWKAAAERHEPLALMMIDIDHFKLFNDRYGHVPGDTCLRAVGETLSLVTLDTAVLVARYGGEEFALLLPGLDIARASELAEEARRAVEDLLINHSESPLGHVTISIGAHAIVPDGCATSADLVEAADCALYEAKRRGRNTVVAYGVSELRAAS